MAVGDLFGGEIYRIADGSDCVGSGQSLSEDGGSDIPGLVRWVESVWQQKTANELVVCCEKSEDCFCVVFAAGLFEKFGGE